MITFNLKKKWYDLIRSGEKTVEYREVKKYWAVRLINAKIGEIFSKRPISCRLRLGYTKRYMTATITKIEIVPGKDTDLAVNCPVYAMHLENVREEQ